MSISTLSRHGGRRAAIAAALLGLVATPLALGFAAPAQAVSDGLVISEVFGANGTSNLYNQDFVEIHNPTGGPIDATGMSVQYRSATSASGASSKVDLAGVIPAGAFYLVGGALATGGTSIPTPDAANTGMNMSGTAGVILLANTTTLLTNAAIGAGPSVTGNPQIEDLVGYGSTPNIYETGRAPAPSNTTAIWRDQADTDNNTDDFSVTSVGNPASPTNSSFVPGDPDVLTATDPADVTADEDVALSAITLEATGGTAPYSWEVTGLPAGVTETSDGVIEGTPTDGGVSTVTATVTDSATPTAATDSVEFTITVEATAPFFAIADIQGTDNTSTMQGDRVRTEGVVTATHPGAAGLSGFFMQTAGEEGVDYDTPGASDGIMVYTGTRTTPTVGDSVAVTGTVHENFGMTRLVTARDSQIVDIAALAPVVPKAQLPGADCAEGACLTGTDLAAAREDYEGEAFLPTAPFTVTDSYDGGATSSSNFGEFTLAANSTDPLYVPLELARPGSQQAADIAAYNAAHQVLLDDGSSVNYTSNSSQAFPWLTPTNTVRAGAGVTFVKPVILDYAFGNWRLQPEERIPSGDDGSDWVAFEQDRPATPDPVGGDLKIATFNMLNYFNTIGEEWAASDGTSTGGPGTTYNFANPRRCSYYNDRAGARITNNTCEQDAVDPVSGLNVKLPGPRGAATPASFERQEDKILAAINTMDADIVSLEEIENSVKLYDPAIDGDAHPDADRDDAISRLVTELNAAWAAAHPDHVGPRWAYVASPRQDAQPTKAEQDAIRNGFIYDPSKVEAVGRSRILTNAPAMRNAREPLAQAFKPLGGGRADRFVVIVNHFKSKGGPDDISTINGDNLDSGDGAGFYNGDRKRQAAALLAFADEFASDKNIGPVFLTGDFNAYSMEDPVQIITDGGFHDLHSDNGETTYFFGGLAGSLDHVFANDEALAMVTGQTVWPINANEPVYYEYSRFNYNVTNLYDTSPFRSSDHNPEIIGIETGVLVPDPARDVVQVLGINDFHGRILATEGGPEAGAASLAGAVKELRAENPDTVFAAAGDLVGASTFESFIANDKPTIDALNEAGLEVSAAGNHEFDQGYDDLVNRIMAPYDADTNPEGGALWQYIAGNVRFRDTEDGHTAGDPALPETWFSDLGDGRTVGFVGAVTEDLPALVAAGGIEDIVVEDIVESVNANAEDLTSPGGCNEVDGCDLVVMLVHEGAASTSYSAVTNDSTFAQIVEGASPEIDAIVSGHTHLAYNHKVPVQQWITEGRAVTERPVVSAGQYGAKLNRLEFEFLPGTEQLVDVRQTVLNLNDYDADANTQAIVDAAADFAAAEGNVPLGDIEAPFQRARRTDPTNGGAFVENRGGESTLGNLVAEIQRWQVGADIAFMNPGGLRADMLGTDGDPRVLTYRQAADVQPFANTLVSMDLTGAQIKTILEQQWQRDADGNVPSRPFLRLGTSDGLVVTEDVSRPEGDRITGIWLNGVELDPAQSYRVVANSFLASGTGDNFWGFAAATDKQDTGKTDLQGVVEYMAEFAPHGVTSLPVDYRQHAVGVSFPGGAPAPAYAAGDTLEFTLGSLAMTGASDVHDTAVEVLLGDTVVGGPFAVTNTLPNHPNYDAAGTASVSVAVPAGVVDGPTEFTVRGVDTGTEVPVVVNTSDGLPDSTVSAADTSMVTGQPGSVDVTVTPSTATGTVSVRDGITLLGTATLVDGAATVTIGADALAVGEHELTLVYSGDSGTSPSEGTVTMTVNAATPTVTAVATPVETGQTTTIDVTVSATGVSPTGTVTASVGGSVVDSATLSGGAATLTAGPWSTPGDRNVVIDYLGDTRTAAGSTVASVTVTGPATPPAVDTTTTATAEPMVYGTAGAVEVAITSANPTSGSVQLLDGDTVISSGTAADDGTATLAIPGTALPAGTHTLTVKYLGDTDTNPSQGTVQVVVAKADSATQSSVTPSEVVVQQDTATVQASVTAPGYTPTGSVEFLVDGVVVATAPLTGGSAFAEIGPFPTTGPRSVTVAYLGDGNTTGSESSASTVSVVKATPTMTVTRTPDRVVVNKTRVKLTVDVTSAGQPATGDVRIKWDGHERTGTLEDGTVRFELPKFNKRGTYEVKVVYLGTDLIKKATETIEIKVVKKKK